MIQLLFRWVRRLCGRPLVKRYDGPEWEFMPFTFEADWYVRSAKCARTVPLSQDRPSVSEEGQP